MAVIDDDDGVMAIRQVANLRQFRQGAVHREDAIGHDQPHPAAGRIAQTAFKLRHVAVAIADAPGLAEADAVDDAGVVQLVAEDGVLVAEDRLEQAAVGVPAGAVEDGVVLAEEAGDGGLQAVCADPGCRR